MGAMPTFWEAFSGVTDFLLMLLGAFLASALFAGLFAVTVLVLVNWRELLLLAFEMFRPRP